ncbi:unnamed protein product, partial [Prunus brigantina]
PVVSTGRFDRISQRRWRRFRPLQVKPPLGTGIVGCFENFQSLEFSQDTCLCRQQVAVLGPLCVGPFWFYNVP